VTEAYFADWLGSHTELAESLPTSDR
jgi:hypothetical protein